MKGHLNLLRIVIKEGRRTKPRRPEGQQREMEKEKLGVAFKIEN